jgi:hypothetical protein
MNGRVVWLCGILQGFCLALLCDVAWGEGHDAAKLLPRSTVLYAEWSRPGETLERILDHPLTREIRSLPEFREATESADYRRAYFVMRLLEGQLGMPVRDMWSAVTGNGIALAVDGQTGGTALFIHSRDEESLQKLRETVVQLARDDARQKGRPDPFELRDYRGIPVYAVNKGGFADLGSQLLYCSNRELGQQLLDRHLDGDAAEALRDDPRFVQALDERPEEAEVWAYVNVETIRSSGKAERLFSGHSENPLAELLVGGLLDTLRQTPYATLSLSLDDERAGVQLSLPHEGSWVSEARQHYFGADGQGVAPALLDEEDGLLWVSAYRDLSQLWLHAGDLFDEETNDELAKADSNLATLFSGRDFGEEILGAFVPGIQLIVARQTFAADGPQPALRLPSFALIMEMRDPETTTRELRRTFQSLIGFLNVTGAMNGQPQLELDMERDDRVELVTSRYLPEPSEADSRQARINFNFSPTLGFAGTRFVLSSTQELARKLTSAEERAAGEVDRHPVNTAAQLDMSVLRDVLGDNVVQLVSQNMLEQGHTREEAERQIHLLFAALDRLEDVRLQLTVREDRIQVDASLRLRMRSR